MQRFVTAPGRGVLVIDIESYLKPAGNRDHDQKQILLYLYQLLNYMQIYCFAKDQIICLILAHFGGFYFDIDIRPKCNPFFQNMTEVYIAINNNPSFIKVRGSAHLCKLLTFSDPTNPMSGGGTDVSFYMACNPQAYLKPNAASFFQFTDEERMEHLGIYYNYLQHFHNTDILSHLFDMNFTDLENNKYYAAAVRAVIDQFKDDPRQAASTCMEMRQQLILMENLKPPWISDQMVLVKESVVTPLFNLILSMTNFVYVPYAIQEPNSEMLNENYKNFYRNQLFYKFEQKYLDEPSSLSLTGYQKLEKKFDAANTIKTFWRNPRGSR